jgi:uncharacterized membrane protein YeaQ/YmgE (transglycosylase-associated protein family)
MGQFIGFKENGINPYIWCVVGVVLGGLACLLSGTREKILVLENLGVGVFGTFIGGDFVAAMFNHGAAADKGLTMGTIALAVAGGVVALALLRLMQRAVGPMQRSKAPRRRD